MYSLRAEQGVIQLTYIDKITFLGFLDFKKRENKENPYDESEMVKFRSRLSGR